MLTTPFSTTDGIEEHIRTRMERHLLHDSATAPVLWVIVHEAALCLRVGDASAMAWQLDHLADQALLRSRVEVQVLPFSARAHPFLDTSVSLMHFDDAPPGVYTESAYSGQLIEDSSLVDQFCSAYDLARAAALSPEASLPLIKSAAKGHTTDAHLT